MKKLLLLCFAAFAAAACSDNDDPAPVPETVVETLGFEAADLGTEGYIWGKEMASEQDDTDYNGNPIKSDIFYGPIYTEKDATVYTYFTDYGHTYDSWSAFVVSNRTDMQTAGAANDKSVYATGGAGGSSNFAVGYYNAWVADGKGIPTVRFGSAVKPQSVALALPTYVYYYFTQDVTTPEKSEFKIVVTGYDGTTKTADASLALVSGTTVKTGWQTVDLSSLGQVTSVEFSIECEDFMAPTNLCMDDLKYEK